MACIYRENVLDRGLSILVFCMQGGPGPPDLTAMHLWRTMKLLEEKLETPSAIRKKYG